MTDNDLLRLLATSTVVLVDGREAVLAEDVRALIRPDDGLTIGPIGHSDSLCTKTGCTCWCRPCERHNWRHRAGVDHGAAEAAYRALLYILQWSDDEARTLHHLAGERLIDALSQDGYAIADARLRESAQALIGHFDGEDCNGECEWVDALRAALGEEPTRD